MRDYLSEEAVTQLVANLKIVRKQKKLSHDKIAARTGLSRSTISMIECGQNTPTILTCLRLCRAMDIRLSDMLQKLGE